jgi:protein ImuB
MYACIHLPDPPSSGPDAGALAGGFSPHVEMIDARTAVLSITDRQLRELTINLTGWQGVALTHDLQSSWQGIAQPNGASIAVATTVEAAILAARNFSGLTILQPGDESRVLGSLPVDALHLYALPADPEIFRTLDAWGIKSLAELARLPEDGLAERLGPRGLTLQKLARGALDRPLVAGAVESVYEESIELDYRIELLEPMLFLIGRFLHDLCGRLDRQSLAAAAVWLTMNGEERMVRLPFPTRDVKFLLKLVQHDLEKHPLAKPVEKIRLRILPTFPRRVQHGLFTPAAPEPEKLELTLGKIRALVGAENVKIPEIRDTYRPGWGAAESRLAFRYFRPPLEARVETEAGRPKHLWTRMFQGEVMKIAGPWRTSGEWWKFLWDRDEWDVALSNGSLYRVYWDRGMDRHPLADARGSVRGSDSTGSLADACGSETPRGSERSSQRGGGRWFVEGSYD